MGPPFRIIGLTLSRIIIDDLGLAVAEDELEEVGAGVGGSGGEGAPLDIPPTRNWSRRAATLLLLLEEEGGWVMGGDGAACVVVAELWISAVFTALKGAVVEPPMLLRLLLEKLRAGVGGGGGFTDGRAGEGNIFSLGTHIIPLKITHILADWGRISCCRRWCCDCRFHCHGTAVDLARCPSAAGWGTRVHSHCQPRAEICLERTSSI